MTRRGPVARSDESGRSARAEKHHFDIQGNGPPLRKELGEEENMRAFSIGFIAICVGCAGEAPAASEQTTSAELQSDCNNPNPALFAKDARPYGASMVDWSERLWRFILEQPFDHNPLFDPTGADC